MKHYHGGGELWLDELVVNGERHRFDENPHWEGLNNRRSYTTCDGRPWFDFGFSATHFAGGKCSGELGGLDFLGEGRFVGVMGVFLKWLERLSPDSSCQGYVWSAVHSGSAA